MLFRFLLASAAIICVTYSALAQEFPVRPITVVVPFAPGGGMDFILRTFQGGWESALGQPLIIENKPGATGNIGNAFVAKAEPDGYTLLLTQVNIGVFPHVFAHLSYNPLTDFVAIGGVAETPNACVVNPASKYQTFSDIINDARISPGKIKYGTTGVGAPSHLAAEMISRINNVRMTQVPYKGPIPALTDLMGGFIDFICLASVNALPFIRDGKLKAIAVTTQKRSVLLPEVPTITETGIADMNESSRYILVAPAKTPRPIVDRISRVLASVLGDATVEQVFFNAGFEASHTSSIEVSTQIREQYDTWGPIVKELNLRLD
jgi:tripartite-type tricarboxylate transporter receptor subunit TctC